MDISNFKQFELSVIQHNGNYEPYNEDGTFAIKRSNSYEDFSQIKKWDDFTSISSKKKKKNSVWQNITSTYSKMWSKKNEYEESKETDEDFDLQSIQSYNDLEQALLKEPPTIQQLKKPIIIKRTRMYTKKRLDFKHVKIAKVATWQTKTNPNYVKPQKEKYVWSTGILGPFIRLFTK